MNKITAHIKSDTKKWSYQRQYLKIINIQVNNTKNDLQSNPINRDNNEWAVLVQLAETGPSALQDESVPEGPVSRVTAKSQEKISILSQ